MAVNTIANNALGNYLKIFSQNAVYSNLAEQSAMWKNVLKKKKGPAGGRELRYLLRSAFGAGAAQFVGVAGAVEYPGAQQASISEATTQFKDFAVTIEVERTLISKAIDDFRRYGEPLAEELKSKTIATARMLSAAAYQDGTGIIGTVLTSAYNTTTDVLTIVLDTANTARGHVGWFEYGDKIKFNNTAGTAQDLSGGTLPDYYSVEDKTRSSDTVTFKPRTSAGVHITDNTAAGAIGAGDFAKRYGTTAVDTTAIVVGTTEYNTLSEAFLGLEALTLDDGSKVDGVARSGAIKGTRYDAGADALDSLDFQGLLTQVKINVGEGRYKYSDAIMASEALDTLVESRETDRRFVSLEDTDRGVPRMGYVHGNDRIVFMTDEFCQKKRIWVIPEGDVLQFHGADFEFVRPEGGQRFFLRPSTTGGHFRQVRAYMEGSGALISVHPSAMGVIHNFTL